MIDLTPQPAAGPLHGRRRGRPPACDTAQRDASILAVAERLFLEQGFRQVSIALVARTAGVATRTIYARFGGKRGMLDKIVEMRSGDRGLMAMLAEPRPGSPVQLHRLAAHAFDYVLSPRMDLLNADVLAARTPRTSGRFHHLYSGLWYDMLSAVLYEGEWKLGMFSVTDTTILADLFIGCLIREYSAIAQCPGGCELPSEIGYQMANKAVRRFFSTVSSSRANMNEELESATRPYGPPSTHATGPSSALPSGYPACVPAPPGEGT
jgi:AcrR family transcriptional regulator